MMHRMIESHVADCVAHMEADMLRVQDLELDSKRAVEDKLQAVCREREQTTVKDQKGVRITVQLIKASVSVSVR